MFTIRQEQMDHLGASKREEFVESTRQNLEQMFPYEPSIKDEPVVRSLIEFGIERAGQYGISRGREVMLFIFLVQDMGRDFEKQSNNVWVQELLADTELEEQEKMDLIYARLQLAAGNANYATGGAN